MTASYRLIDYTLRPAKYAERKMLAEALTNLRVFDSLKKYCYVGFGSIWYADCVLFHHALGIERIISIEKEKNHKDRFEFNNPYRGIELRMDEAAVVLPGLDWSQRKIIWLDYDEPLSPSILDDIRTVSTRACSGTALIVSVQAEKIFDNRDPQNDPIHVTNREQFMNYFGIDRTPAVISVTDLQGWGLSKFSRRIIREEIENNLQLTNKGSMPEEPRKFRQFVAFEYADGAKMTTIGGVIVDAKQSAKFDESGLADLSFFRNGDDVLRINVPLLTPREMHKLDKSLPLIDGAGNFFDPIPESDAKRYAEFYRYLPKFAAFEP